MGITLYGISGSRASRNMWMLNELNLAYESVPTNDRTGETRTPEFLNINPNGKVPCLIDNGVRIVESMAINLHLANKYNGGLWYDDADSQGQAFQWSFWGMLEIDGYMMDVLSAETERQRDAGLARLQHACGVLNAHLQGQEYLIGDRFSVADLNAASCHSGGAFMNYDFHDFPDLYRWLKACFGRSQAAIPDSTLTRFNSLLNR